MTALAEFEVVMVGCTLLLIVAMCYVAVRICDAIRDGRRK